jgi:hypothetical protein
MIAAARSDYSGLGNCLGKQRVESPPRLEAACVLHLFKLQAHGTGQTYIDMVKNRCAPQMGFDPIHGRPDFAVPVHFIASLSWFFTH